MEGARSAPAAPAWGAEVAHAPEQPASVGAAPRGIADWLGRAANTRGESETDSFLCPHADAAGSLCDAMSDTEVGQPAAPRLPVCGTASDVEGGLPPAPPTAASAAPAAAAAPPQAAEEAAQPAAAPRCPCPGLQWICTPDWMAGVVGVVAFSLLLVLGRIGGLASVVPHFQTWEYNPLDALYNRTTVNVTGNPAHTHVTHGAEGAALVLQLQLLAAVMAALLMAAAWVTGTYGDPEDKKRPQCTVDMLVGFLVIFAIALFSQWISMQTYLSRYGIEDSIVSMFIGGLITELNGGVPPRLKAIADLGEWLVKIALTCMVVPAAALGELGPRGMIAGWIGKPVSIAAIYCFGTRVLGVDPALAILVSTGISWCGPTAIAAVAKIVLTPDDDTYKAAATGVVAVGVIPWTFGLGYLGRCLPGSAQTIGAWLGLAVDLTGNVVISGQIAGASSRFAGSTHGVTETAPTVKMTMNAGLGLMVVGIGFCWNLRGKGSAHGSGGACRSHLNKLGDNFPKFLFGYVINCAILSWYGMDNGAAADELRDAANKLCRWFMATGFAAIGLATNRRELCEKVSKAGGLRGLCLLWLIGSLIDNLWAFGLAYVSFEVCGN